MTSASPFTVVFDLDGTLVESAPDLVDALAVALAAEGVAPVPYEDARGLIGAGARALVQRGLAVAGRTPSAERMDELHAIFLAHYEDHMADRTRPYPGVATALDRLVASGAKLGVCTNKIERFAVKLLAELGLTDRFGAIVGGDTFGVSKPDAAPLLGTIARLGGSPDRCVMVGDSGTDVATARAAGVPVVVVSFGYTDVAPADLGGDALIDHFDQLDEALARLRA
jgi:phosphoglycolate phosphatase